MLDSAAATSVAMARVTDSEVWVAWSATGRDGSGDGVFLRRVTEAGGVSGTTEIQVNTATVGNQNRADVAVLAGGQVVVVWTDQPVQNGAARVMARVFDAAGVALTSAFEVSPLNSHVPTPKVSGTPDGGFTVYFGYYNGVATNTDVHSRHYTLGALAGVGADMVAGSSAADSLAGQDGNDALDGGGGNDLLDGGAGDDLLVGGLGNDYLRGGTGADAMQGGAGDDTYLVTDAGDTADETGGDGTDLVISRISWTLGAGIENLTLGNGGTWSGAGNELANVITGNSLANTITGLAGNDTLNGGGGNDSLDGGDDNDTLNGESQNDTLNGGAGTDTLNGGDGNDALNGGTGADAMTGGAGNDSYVVDDGGDTVTEVAGAGTDAVSASISYSLTANVERLTLTGSADLNGTGNVLANILTGNSGANTLSGGDGADVLYGLAGNDVLNGEAGNDALDGGADNDSLAGGAGQDRLTGGTGADAFLFTAADIRRTGPGFGLTPDKDQILDLSFAANDRIDLSAIDANALVGGDQAFTFVSALSGVAGQAVLKLSGGKSILSLDVDGDRKADLIVEINGDVTATTANLYTGGGDTNGGWVL